MFIAMSDIRTEDQHIKVQFPSGSVQSQERVARYRDDSLELEILLVGFSGQSLLSIDLLLESLNNKGTLHRNLTRLFHGDGFISTHSEANKAGVVAEYSPSVALARMGDKIIQIEVDLKTWVRIDRPFNLITPEFTRGLIDLAALGYKFEDLSGVYQTMTVSGTPTRPIHTYRLEN